MVFLFSNSPLRIPRESSVLDRDRRATEFASVTSGRSLASYAALRLTECSKNKDDPRCRESKRDRAECASESGQSLDDFLTTKRRARKVRRQRRCRDHPGEANRSFVTSLRAVSTGTGVECCTNAPVFSRLLLILLSGGFRVGRCTVCFCGILRRGEC